MKKLYTAPTAALVTVSEDDILRTSVGHSAAGDGDILSANQFNL